MGYELIGAALILGACGGYGLLLTRAYRQREQELHRLLGALGYMENQLAYQLTSLPDLCRQAGKEAGGIVGEVLRNLGRELSWQSSPDVSGCMASALGRSRELPPQVRRLLVRLGNSLGRFDLPGQLRGLEALGQSCQEQLAQLQSGREPRLRSYRTLGLCAGAALVILLL